MDHVSSVMSGFGQGTIVACSLVRSTLKEHRGDRLEEDSDVVPKRPVPNVPDIKLHAAGVGHVAASADLPQSREAGLRGVVVFDLAAVAI